MKIINEIIRFFDKALNLVITSVFAMCLLFGIYAIYDFYAVVENPKISSEIVRISPKKDEVEIFSIKNLQEINTDIKAWIRISDTNIDYPILKGKDNSKYLNLDYKGEYSTAGSIFLDYRNDSGFLDSYSIIYGHNMKSRLMFSDIKKYSEKEFFNTHKKGILYTLDKIYELEIFAYAVISGYDDIAYNLSIYRKNENIKIIKYFEKISKIFDEESKTYSKLLLLSTCNSTGSNDRAVVLAGLKEISSSDPKTTNQ